MSNYPCTPDLYQPWAYPDYAYHDASSDDAQDPAYLSPTSAYHGPSPVDAQHLGAYNPYFADSVYGGDPYAEHSARNVSSFDSTPAGAPASVYSSTSNSPRLRPDLSRGFSDYRHGYALSQHDAHAAPYNFIDYKLPEQAPVPRVGKSAVCSTWSCCDSTATPILSLLHRHLARLCWSFISMHSASRQTTLQRMTLAVPFTSFLIHSHS